MADTGKNSLSREERIYREADALFTATECIVRFEQKVDALKGAAAKFEKISDYRDAGNRAVACREAAGKAKAEGYKEVFLKAEKKQKSASEKGDYFDAIANYQRVFASRRYGEKAKEQAGVCEKEIARLETKRVWKKRGITVLVLAAVCFLFTLTPAYPFLKGFVREHQGRYREALFHYQNAKRFPLSDKKIRECHLALGERYFHKKMDTEALTELRLAGDEKKALRLIAKAEKRSLRSVYIGERFQYGKYRFLVRRKGAESVLLLYDGDRENALLEQQVKEKTGLSYRDYFWRRVFADMLFSAEEEKLLTEQENAGEFNVFIAVEKN